MAKELRITDDYDSSLYDTATGESCVTERVMDITEDCPSANQDRCLLLYTRDSRGRIVQITRPYQREVYMGMHIHFSVDRLANELNASPRNDTFGSWASELGLTKIALKSLIETHAPTI